MIVLSFHQSDFHIYFFLRFFQCGPFLKSLLNLLQYCFCFMIWFFGHEACGILAPRPGIEPAPPALEGEVLTTGPPGKSLVICFSLFLKLGARECGPSRSNFLHRLSCPVLYILYIPPSACQIQSIQLRTWGPRSWWDHQVEAKSLNGCSQNSTVTWARNKIVVY